MFDKGSGSEHAVAEQGHYGVVDHTVDLCVRHVFKLCAQTQKVGNAHERVSKARHVLGVDLVAVLGKTAAVAVGKGHVVVDKHLSLYGKTAPDDIVDRGVGNGVLDEASDTFTLALVTGRAIGDRLAEGVLDVVFVACDEVTVEIGLGVKVDIKRPDRCACRLTDVGHGHIKVALVRKELFRRRHKGVDLTVAELGLGELDSLDLKKLFFRQSGDLSKWDNTLYHEYKKIATVAIGGIFLSND